MSNSYVRKTDNPNMGWSDERKAEYSAQCKVARANGTWHKKSKKAVGLAISNGKREAIKRRNRSEGQKRRHQESSVKTVWMGVPEEDKADDQANIKEIGKRVGVSPQQKNGGLTPAMLTIGDFSSNAIVDLFDLIEDHLGVRPNYDDFLNNAVEDKLAKFKEALCR